MLLIELSGWGVSLDFLEVVANLELLDFLSIYSVIHTDEKWDS